ncbi:winged helix DNA-binding domain-containing protein [Streptomyces sp. NPDC005953]|uniref:winged helix DNA-binding domain-containing protein n=1 Tax=Streptomyces sp. NPDC005953 TaxID=3156719 RepID=UPI0033FB445C
MSAGPRCDTEQVRLLRAGSQAVGDGVREDSAAAVVRRVFALQAQDRTAVDLGIRVRARRLVPGDVRTAYEDDRSIVRTWLMRGTLHTIPGEDLRWVLALLAPRLLAATAHRYRALGLDETVRERARSVIEGALSDSGPLSRAALTRRLAGADLPFKGQATFHLIRNAALSGIVCHGPLRGGEETFVLLADWLPHPGVGAGWEPERALLELARRYLHGHAPVGPDDFALWSGLPITEARRAWRALADGGEIGEYGDGEYGELSMPSGRKPTTAEPRNDVRLLPAYDGFLVGYRSRAFAVPDGFERQVWPGGGQIRPTVIADGLAVATWSRGRSTQGGVRREAFTALSAPTEAAIERDAVEVAAFLHPSG